VGGLARAATIVQQVRQALPNVLLFDSGDSAHGTVEEYLSAGRSIVDAINTLGYDAVCPGNHEFGWGREQARALLSALKMPVVCANMLDEATGTPWANVKPWIILTVGKLRVAVFGLITRQAYDIEWPSFLEGVRIEDPVAVASRLVPELRRQADLVILLSHLGLKADQELAAAVPGIDIILGGHSHDNVRTRMFVGATLIAQTGAHMERIGRIDLILKRKENSQGPRYEIVVINGKGGRWWGVHTRAPLGAEFPPSVSVTLDGSIPLNHDTVQAYAPYREQARRVLAEEVADVESEIGDNGTVGDTPLTRLLADQIRAAAGVDIALVDGKLKGRLPAGRLAVSQLWGVIGGYTGHHIVTVRVSGEAVRQFLEQWAGSPQDLAIGVSGLQVEFSPSQPAGSRIQRVTVNGSALDPAREYVVGGFAYVIRRFSALMGGQILDHNAGWSRDLVTKMLRDARLLKPDTAPRLIAVGG
ncbi:MAG: bifunctional metallophosphatase/5'-nucleotidase, partial [Armatimonadota bacterium]